VDLLQDRVNGSFDNIIHISMILIEEFSNLYPEELYPMSKRLLFEAKEVLLDLKRLRNALVKSIDSLSDYEGISLLPSFRKKLGKNYYYGKRAGQARGKYLGDDANPHVHNIKVLSYSKEALTVVDSDIGLLERLLGNYVAPEFETINRRLSKTYRTPVTGSRSVSNLPEQAQLWKEQREAEKSKYPPYKPEQLKHPALDGTLMRSKSEVIIANILLLAKIPFVYELPMRIQGKLILPDFTILSLIDYKSEIIIDHQGMMFVDEYASKHIRSVRTYLQSDLIPNQNLFFTFDNANETLDPRQLESILVKYVKPSLDISQFRY
jgi:hypothetical protein